MPNALRKPDSKLVLLMQILSATLVSFSHKQPRSTFWIIALILAVAASTLLTPPAVLAQFYEEEGPEVASLNIEFRGLRNVSEEAVRAYIKIKEGEVYSQNMVDRSIRSLYGTRLFDLVEVETELLEGDRVAVTFVVQPKYRIHEIRIVGNESFSDGRLRKKIESKRDYVLDERDIRKDRDALFEYYLEKGYSRVSVVYEIDNNEETGTSIVTFRIEEGRKLKIKKVNFEGNENIKSRKLRSAMETKRRSWLSWLTGTGRFDESLFQEDLDTLRAYYKDKGYLDVDLNEDEITLEYPKKNQIVINIKIDEGRQYQVGNISMEGNTLYPTEFLLRYLQLMPGDVFSPSKLDEDREQLVDIYGAIGYLDTSVRPERIPNIQTGDMDIKYHIREGEKFRVESVHIEGNDKTKSIVILRELALAPGDIFNLVYMKNSEARLKNTRFFDEVRLSPEPTNIPGRRHLKVSVKEAHTGQFQIGAGFSSLEDAVVFFEFSQGNFDLFNWRSFFQGDGQKFRLRLAIGSASSEAVLMFEEPWLFERRLALGFELYRRETEYNSTYYDELRTGFEVYVRKRLIELIVARLAYSYEVVSISDVSPNAPIGIFEDDYSVSKVNLSLVRDTRDSLLFPTRGARVQQITEYAGLGGDIDYLKLENRSSIFIPTFELGEQTLSILVRAGAAMETGDDPIPFFDRFFLGGPYTLRGFEYREVGPKDDTFGEPLGGYTYGFGSIEYTIKLADPLRIAVFYDWGFVNEDEWDFNPQFYNDNWGFGVRILVLGSPLRLDFGIPITTDDFNDEGNQFNFAFGTRF